MMLSPTVQCSLTKNRLNRQVFVRTCSRLKLTRRSSLSGHKQPLQRLQRLQRLLVQLSITLQNSAGKQPNIQTRKKWCSAQLDRRPAHKSCRSFHSAGFCKLQPPCPTLSSTKLLRKVHASLPEGQRSSAQLSDLFVWTRTTSVV